MDHGAEYPQPNPEFGAEQRRTATLKRRQTMVPAVRDCPAVDIQTVMRPGRAAGIGMLQNRAPKARHSFAKNSTIGKPRVAGVFEAIEMSVAGAAQKNVPVLRTSILCPSQPRPHGRGYSMPALRASLFCVSLVIILSFM
jgi:hypothetical protein